MVSWVVVESVALPCLYRPGWPLNIFRWEDCDFSGGIAEFATLPLVCNMRPDGVKQKQQEVLAACFFLVVVGFSRPCWLNLSIAVVVMSATATTKTTATQATVLS